MIERVMWENDVLTMRQLLEDTAQRYYDKPCIRFEDEDGKDIVKSYREMRNDSIAVADFLKKENISREHIALLAKTNYNYLTAMNGIMAAGDVAIPMSYDLSVEQMVTILTDCDADCIVCDGYTRERVELAVQDLPRIRKVYSLDDRDFFNTLYSDYNKTDDALLPDENPDDTTVIIYTSGTTGAVKGACLSSRAIISNIYFKEMSFEGDNVALNVLPMHHIFCFSCDYLKNLKDGVLICLNGDISNVAKNLLKYEPTVVRMVPMIVDGLYKKVNVIRKKNPDLTPRECAQRVFGRRLTNIIVSGAAFVSKVADDFETMGIEVRQGYGMTETGPRISVPDGKTCAASGGRVISLCEIRLSDVGEIQVKSPSLFTEYYKKPAETEAVFTEDGWMKTGDIGRLTDDRELFITGRLKNIIILSNGENVSPEEIEKELQKNPLVKEIILYGSRNMLCADIYPDLEYAQHQGIEDAESEINKIVDNYNKTCEQVKQISSVTVTKEPLPKTSTGKIIRNK